MYSGRFSLLTFSVKNGSTFLVSPSRVGDVPYVNLTGGLLDDVPTRALNGKGPTGSGSHDNTVVLKSDSTAVLSVSLSDSSFITVLVGKALVGPFSTGNKDCALILERMFLVHLEASSVSMASEDEVTLPGDSDVVLPRRASLDNFLLSCSDIPLCNAVPLHSLN